MTEPRQLRATAKYPDWTPDEDRQLREFYARSYAGDPTPQAKLAEQLGRSLCGLRSRADKLGISQSRAILGGFVTTPKWTDREVAILKTFYGKVSTRRLLELLPGRTKASIYSRANVLGLEHGFIKPWSADEVRALAIAYRRGIAIADVAIAVGRKALTVSKYATNHGFDFGRRPLTRIRPRLQDILALDDPTAPDLEKAIPRARPLPKQSIVERERKLLERDRFRRRRKDRRQERINAAREAERERLRVVRNRAADEKLAARNAEQERRDAERDRAREQREAERARERQRREAEQQAMRLKQARRDAATTRANVSRRDSMRRTLQAKAAALVDSGNAASAGQNIALRGAINELIANREQQARQSDPLEQAKLALQRRGRVVYSMVVYGGPTDRFFVSGLGKDVTPAELVREAERLAA